MRGHSDWRRQNLCGAMRILYMAAALALMWFSHRSEAALDRPSGVDPGWRVNGPIVKTEFIFDEAPFPSCHASTIAEVKGGLVAAWFGGQHEQSNDVGIWMSRYDGRQWSKVTEIANGMQPLGIRYPCWNPVLFQPMKGPLLLFYKIGPSPRT